MANVANPFFLSLYDTDITMAIKFLNSVNADSGVLYVDADNNRVGIGTTSPAQKLHVDGNIRVGDVNDSIFSNRFFGLGNASVYLSSNSGYPIIFNAGGTEKMRVANSGNVGIGTTSPAQKLDVIGNVRTTGSYNISNVTILEKDSSYTMLRNANGVRSIYLGGAADPTTYLDGDTHRFRTSGGGSVKMVITSSGNVGIGTTSPSYKLHVNGDIGIDSSNALIFDNNNSVGQSYVKSGGYLHLIIDSNNNQNVAALVVEKDTQTAGSGTELFRVQEDGNVGIGTSSPAEKLEVNGNARIGAAGGAASVSIAGDGSTTGGFLYSDTNQTILSAVPAVPLIFRTTNSERMRITSSGNVGIGTASPRSKLEIKNGTTGQSYTNQSGLLIDVNGTSNSYSSLHVGSNSGANNFVVTNAGNTGIGIASPAEKLHVYDPASDNHLAKIRVQGGATSGYGELGIQSGYVRLFANGTITYAANATNTYWYTNSNSSMALNPTGLGIGTTSPSKKLHVSGDSQFDAGGSGQTILVGRASGQPSIKAQTDNGGHLILDSTSNFMSLNHYVGQNIVLANGGGNVGIGTTSPAKQLQVRGSAPWIRIEESSASNKRLDLWVDPSSAIAYIAANQSAQQLSFQTASTDRIRILNNGYVGVGTTSPNRNLHVIGQFAIDNSAGTPTAGMLISADSTSNKIYSRTANNNSTALAFEIISGSTSSLYIKSNGKVGLGTTNPNEELEVKSSSFTTVAVNTERNTSGENIGSFAFYGRNDASTPETLLYSRIMSSMTDVTDGSENSDIYFQQINDGTIQERFRVKSSGEVQLSAYGAGYLRTDASGNIIADVSTVEDTLATVTTRGNTTTNSITVGGITVGDSHFIGNQIGYDNLLIISSAAENIVLGGANGIFFNTNAVSASNAGDNRMYLSNAGNLGIGTSSPTSQLTLSDPTAPTLEFNRQGSNANGWIKTTDSSQNVEAAIQMYGNEMRFFTNGESNQRMVINSSGNVGIGTTSPTQSKLVVDGDISIPRGNALVFLESITGSFRAKITSQNTFPVFNGLEFYTGGVSTSPKMIISDAGNLQLLSYGAGYLKSDANGNITVDADIIEDTLDSVTNRGSTTSNSVAFGTTTKQANTTATISGAINAAGKTTYRKVYGSLNTTGNAIAGLLSSFNGASAMFEFTCYGHSGHYQRVVYSCWNTSGTSWNVKKVIDEGTNQFDVTVDALAATRTFTFVSRSGTASYSPTVTIEHIGSSLDTSYLA